MLSGRPQEERVTILLSVRNGEQDLPSTLRSIENQTFRAWKVIAINDGSSDRTASILETFKKAHPGQVTLIHHAQSIGLTRSLIEGARLVETPTFARVDAGDEFFPTKLEQQLQFLHKHPDTGVVGCNYEDVFLPSGRSKFSQLPQTDRAIRQHILKKNPFAHSCVLLRTKTYNESGGYHPDIRYGQDYELWFRIINFSKATNLPEILSRRVNSDASVSRTHQREQMIQCLKTRWKYMNHLRPLHYLTLVEPLSVILLPQKLKMFLRPILQRLFLASPKNSA